MGGVDGDTGELLRSELARELVDIEGDNVGVDGARDDKEVAMVLR